MSQSPIERMNAISEQGLCAGCGLCQPVAGSDRHQGLGDIGRIVPQTQRLRLEALAQEMPESYREYQRAGTRQRVEQGKATEPTPEDEDR